MLAPGDRLVIFRDGVSEAVNASGEEFGEPRIIDLLQKRGDDEPSILLEGLLAGVREYATGAPQADDITAMVMRYDG
jgi:sigma-B regulation protein RsbU (phosphoserine phosphatase)